MPPDTHASLLERHKAVMPSWVSLYYEQPISIVRGEGRHVWDAEGRRYLDGFGGILTTSTAHALPEVVEAIREQAGRVLHTSTAYLVEPAIELAEQVARLSTIDDARVFFCTSGTEANDTALLLSSLLRRSNQVLALRNSYHGRSFAALAVTGIRSWNTTSLSPLHVAHVGGAYRYRSPWRDLPDDQYNARAADELRELLATQVAGDVACMIAEPIQGVGGFATPPDGFLGALQEVLDEHGILFVSDEVQTGWGRTGEHFWGFEAHGVRPDAITFAKGLGNGLTIGGIVARRELIECVPGNAISTFGGNPLSTAGALANLRYLLDNDLQRNAAEVGATLARGLRELAATPAGAAIGDVRGKGLMIGIELVEPGTDTPDAAAAARALEAARERGLLLGKGGMHANVLRLAPPMTITTDEARELLDILRDALASTTHSEAAPASQALGAT